MCRGWSHYGSFSCHTGSISNRTKERLAYQMADALNYRVGPHPGEALYGPDAPNNREGPQARDPSKCQNGQSYGERMAKEAF